MGVVFGEAVGLRGKGKEILKFRAIEAVAEGLRSANLCHVE